MGEQTGAASKAAESAEPSVLADVAAVAANATAAPAAAAGAATIAAGAEAGAVAGEAQAEAGESRVPGEAEPGPASVGGEAKISAADEAPSAASQLAAHAVVVEGEKVGNGHLNGNLNGHVNGQANGELSADGKPLNGHAQANGHANGHANGDVNGHADGPAAEGTPLTEGGDEEKGKKVEAHGKEEGDDHEAPEVSPEQSANWLSKLFFFWLNPLMKLGWRKPLEQSDLPPLPTWDDAKEISVGFADAWEAERQKPTPSLTKTLFRAFWYRLTVGAVLQVIVVLLQLTPPIFLNSVLVYIQGGTGNWMHAIFGESFGYFAAAALLVVPTIRSLVEAQFNNVMFRLGVHVKTALVEIVYAKSLRLSNAARQNKSVGEIVTLMQVDTEKVDTEKVSMTTPFLHTSWSALLQVFLNLGLLVYYIGWSAITGFALLIVTIPTQGKLVSLLLKMQRKILLNTGKRVRVVNEVLQGMRVVKAYAWEKSFQESVTGIRAVELEAMKSRVWLRAVQSCLMLATPTLIMVVTFAFYAGVAKNEMNPALVFTALALFNSLRIPLMMYPFVINAILAGHVSIQRVGKFLDSPELKPVDKDEEGGLQDDAVVIKDGTFQWATSKPPSSAPAKAGPPGMGRGPPGFGGGPPGAGKGGPGGAPLGPSGPSSFRRSSSSVMNLASLRRGVSFKAGPKGAEGEGATVEKSERASGLGGLLRRRKAKGEEGKVGKKEAEGKGGADGAKEEDKEPFALKDVNLVVKRGELLAVVGPVGSGKSSLVSAILGEMEVPRPKARASLTGSRRNSLAEWGGEGGKAGEGEKGGEAEKAADVVEVSPAAGESEDRKSPVRINGTVAYCSQQAWIMNASLRQNVLFGHEYEEERYNAILEACALKQDLAALPDGDATEIGERGINLSGGQKQRVSLARAVYADTDIILLDDPLSAVDAHVGAHLFESCIHGILQGRTRIFVTNQLNFVPQCDAIAVINGGTVVEQGKYQELMDKGGEFARLMLESGSHRGAPAGATESAEATGGPHGAPGAKPAKSATLSRAISRGRSLGGSRARMESVARASFSKKGTLVEQEQRAKGMLSLDVYWKYWMETSWIVPMGVLGLYFLVQAVDAFSRFWLAYWTKDQYQMTTLFYLGVYAGLALVYTGLIYFRTLGQAFLGLWTAKKLHQGMLASVLQAPTSFFDTTPVGRILNRFSADQAAVDETLPFSWSAFLNILFSVFGTIVVISVITPIFLAAFFPVALVYFYVQQIYRRTARELKRLDAVSKSPVYQQFTETLNGLPVIRAYGQEERFLRMCDAKLDSNNRANFLLRCCDRWLSVRLELMGNSLVFAAAILAVSQRGTLFAGLAGISIDYALQITASLGMLVRQMTDTENQMNGVERMLEYRDRIEHEAPAEIPETKPKDSWPQKGAIDIEDVSMRYRPNLPLVLKGVSLSVEGGERIGVVGRTGSGKSSLMLCLFRLVEPCGGRIVIDGLDISTLGLADLRSRLSIIPQDPVLFSGTVRSNLDPFKAHSDDEIWAALEHAHLKDKISSLPLKLEAEVAEYGENFSVGERQLLCLGRVLLRKNRILVMDEATSSVDFETDRLIQKTIRTYLKDATMLIIAHRINTVIDASRILVMADGEVAEFDTPAKLLDIPDGRFASLVADTGEQTAQHLRLIARGDEDFFASYGKKDDAE